MRMFARIRLLGLVPILMMMMMMMMMLGTLSFPTTTAFVILPAITTGNRHRMPVILQLDGDDASSSSSLSSSMMIEFQSDDTHFGRGEYHLSASVQEGDVVVYQTGTWLVDWVEVGDGTPPIIRYARIETIQLVWTHNCEHGVLRGIEVKVSDSDSEIADNNPSASRVIVPTMPLVEVEFGPEQLVARIPVLWDEEKDEGVSQVPFEDSMFVCEMNE